MGHFIRGKKTGMHIYNFGRGKDFSYDRRSTNHFFLSLASLIVNILFSGID